LAIVLPQHGNGRHSPKRRVGVAFHTSPDANPTGVDARVCIYIEHHRRRTGWGDGPGFDDGWTMTVIGP
jgi:hypothetical protein